MSLAASALAPVERRPYLPWVAALAALAGVLWLQRETFTEIVAVWYTSSNFNHGFAIPVIAAALLTVNARRMGSVPAAPSIGALAVLLALSAAWLVGRVAGLAAVMNLSAVAMVPVTLWAVLGSEFARRNAFPLAFIMFATPLGEGLVSPLMEITATVVVQALQLTGIPVHREGLYFSIPSGDFEVARACSGIRYLIATVSLGAVFAYLNFGSWRRRAVFMAACLVVPIVANCVRAYGIVLLAHFSDMRLATGVDHFIYGWVFFGVVVFLLCWPALRFSDRDAAPTGDRSAAAAEKGSGRPGLRLCASLVAALALVALGPAMATSAADVPRRPVLLADSLPSSWAAEPAITDWKPVFTGPVAERQLRYRRGESTVDLYAAVYLDPATGAGELVHSANEVYEAPWFVTERAERIVPLEGTDDLVLTSTTLRRWGTQRYRLVWHWYDVDGRRVRSAWRAKALETWRALRRIDGSAAVIAVSSEYEGPPAAAHEALLAFVQEHHAAVAAWITEREVTP